MKFIKLLSVVVVSASVLSGCIIVNSENDGPANHHEYQQHKTIKEKISLLDLGATREEVVEVLGNPDVSKAYELEDGAYYVLYYNTGRKHNDNESVKPVSTPLVFKDGLLVGWGDEILATLNQ